MKQRIWFERAFQLGYAPDSFPEVLERIRGTPARLEERLRIVTAGVTIRRVDDRWSINEQVGHLIDLEPLWTGRLNDLLEGEERLRPADLTNAATHEANHNRAPLIDLLARFRTLRVAAVARLEALLEEDLVRTALHPRLEQPMSIVDLYFFVAEHDDHHLASITRLLNQD